MPLCHTVIPVFIVGCGRSGTQGLGRLFSNFCNVEMHHEYMIHHVQPLGVQYFHGQVARQIVLDALKGLHGAAIKYATTMLWGDSSNKLSWFIPELIDLFPNARFIHVVRDGRKVVSSLYHKLGKECLDDRSVGILRDYLFADGQMPPPEKKYWWPFAHQDSADFDAYWALDQFGRIAYHWAQINDRIEEGLYNVPANQKLQVRLEDITSDKVALFDMMRFVGVAPEEEHYSMMKRPYNVVRPENNLLSINELDVFWKLCGVQMQRYGYGDTAEYLLDYTRGGCLSREVGI